MSARDNIFGRIRRGLGLPTTPHPQEREDALAVLQQKPCGPRPSQTWSDPLARFIERCQLVSTTTAVVDNEAAVPHALQSYLISNQLPQEMVAWPTLAHLPWQEAGLKVRYGRSLPTDLVGVTGAFCAIAETATLMMPSGVETHSSVSLLPETHVAVLSRQRIVNYMEEAWQLYQTEKGSLPRAVNFVSGPSRTADIEQTIIIGAHGPYRVHIIIY